MHCLPQSIEEQLCAPSSSRYYPRVQQRDKRRQGLLEKDNKVVTTQNVKNIETLTKVQNRQLHLELDEEDRADADDGAPAQTKQQKSKKRMSTRSHT